MRIIRSLRNFKPLGKKPVIALGVFDGLHLGHQRIIANLLKEARQLKTTSLIITFSPHPQNQSCLYSLLHRLRLLEEAGVDSCLVIRFNNAFRKTSASQFIEKIIIKKINPAEVIIGENFTFGRYARGNWQLLKAYSQKARFRLRVINVLSYKDRPISSSFIRELIRKGRLTQAEELLGRPVSILGRVIGGYRLGRVFGYPTANIAPDHDILPAYGVYAVRLKIKKKIFRGICYIGNRPTIKNKTGRTNIEVHLFDFKNNLYGRRVQIEFIGRIRSQRRFSSVQRLARQINRDILKCHNKFHI